MQYTDIHLTKNEAIILFEFITNLTENVSNFQHPSEEIVLNNILTILEKNLNEPFQSDWKTILTNARNSFK